MFLKRKRSDSEMSSSSSSMFSSPTQPRENTAATPYGSQFMHQITPLHLSSRTRKRVRDNRPSEEKIHENTLNILYLAQKHHQAVPEYSQAPIISNCTTQRSQQASLHSFWALPAQPTSRDDPSNKSECHLSIPANFQETHCGDCDTVLINSDGDAMDLDIDVDVYGGSSDFACSECRKQVCHQCAISNLGQQRQCLMCAGRRQWVGGLGWVNV